LGNFDMPGHFQAFVRDDWELFPIGWPDYWLVEMTGLLGEFRAVGGAVGVELGWWLRLIWKVTQCSLNYLPADRLPGIVPVHD
jgi:hypothetical protein